MRSIRFELVNRASSSLFGSPFDGCDAAAAAAAAVAVASAVAPFSSSSPAVVAVVVSFIAAVSSISM